MSPKVSPFGSWQSPISAEMVGSSALGLGDVIVDGDTIYWLESRPAEKGRTVLVCLDKSGKARDVTGAEFNIRNAVHEMGGAAAIISDGHVYFSNYSDHRVYKQTLSGSQDDAGSMDGRSGADPLSLALLMVPNPAQALSKPGPYRYADFCHDKKRNRLILVKEDHSEPGMEPLNTLDVLPLDGEHEAEMLLAGSDFFSTPRVSPDGRLLCWLTWSHPNMPWQETKLWTGNLGNDGSLSNMQLVAGGKGESVTQPRWGEDGTLYFVSDKGNGWWNLHASYSGLVEPLVEMEAEFCEPPWVFGMSSYALLSNNTIVCSYTQNGSWKLAAFSIDTREFKPLETPYTNFRSVQGAGDLCAFVAGAADRFPEIASLDIKSGKRTVLKKSSEVELDSGYLSIAQSIEFPTENGKTAYAFFYPAKNKDFNAPANTLPPTVVYSHGGPTGATSDNLDLGVQFWTSRGFSIVDVNYGGSTGFGREYRERLNGGNWGIVDVDDCANVVKYLAKSGLIDENRVAISGGSAGGYTTLSALAFKKVFKAGASYYGVSDLEGLVKDTHKFESRYLDSLIGPYPARKDIYEQRSPVLHADKIICPVIFFQGLEDKIVPPSQSEAMVNALRKKGLPVAYLTFEGEQHGFRRSETNQKCLNAELTFFCKVFAISRDDTDNSFPIENEDKLLA